MAIIKAGTYRFNDVLSAPSANLEEYFVFTSNSTDCEGFGVSLHNQDDSYALFYVESISELSVVNIWNSGGLLASAGGFTGWVSEAYKTIIIPTDSEVSTEFYEWFTANAVLVGITYNGSTTNIDVGQIAVLNCANKRAKSDIVVALSGYGAITYNDVVKAVSKGQTATLSCANKKLVTDVLVCSSGDIPYGCTELAYLEGTGTQYIDTGYKANTTLTRYETRISPTSFSAVMAVAGSRNTQGSSLTDNCLFFINESKLRMDWAAGTGEIAKTKMIPLEVDALYDISITRGECIVNGEKHSFTNSESVEQNNNFLIGTATNGSNNSRTPGFNGKVYFSKIYDGGLLILYLVPVLDSNGVPCMFDKVSGEFFYNAGTGTFLYG